LLWCLWFGLGFFCLCYFYLILFLAGKFGGFVWVFFGGMCFSWVIFLGGDIVRSFFWGGVLGSLLFEWLKGFWADWVCWVPGVGYHGIELLFLVVG